MKIVNILGTGPSLKHYTPDENETIGVNNIWEFHQTDYIVCVDKPARFEPKRLAQIKVSKPGLFYTHLLEDWAPFIGTAFKINLAPIRGSVDTLDDYGRICWSNNSTYVAAVMAFHHKADRIILHGVDFTGHKDLSQPAIQKKAIDDFVKLFLALNKRNVELLVGSNDSMLSGKIPVLKS